MFKDSSILIRMRRKGLEPSQDELPLEPESSASAIPPSPLTKSILSQDTRECKYFFEKIKKISQKNVGSEKRRSQEGSVFVLEIVLHRGFDKFR